MDYTAGIPGLGRLPIDRLLEALNDLRLKSLQLGVSARPLLSLRLRGGAELEGWLVDYGPGESVSDKEPMIVLHRAWPSPQQPAEAVCFVSLREVQAITVFEAPAVARHLRPKRSPLELRRMADRLVKELSENLAISISLQWSLEKVSNEQVEILAEQVDLIRAAFIALIAESDAKEVLKKTLTSLQFELQDDAGVSFSRGKFSFNLSAKGPAQQDIKAQIESLL